MMHRFLILGGDPRQLYLARFLIQAGHETSLYYEASPSFSLKEAMEDSHIILCPVPFTKDKAAIYSHNRLPGLDIAGFLPLLKQGHTLFGGNIPLSVEERCRSLGIPCLDFMKMEEVACKNAIATAEGAVAEAISLGPMNLHGSKCLVAGWGRCGEALAWKLKNMDAHVTVGARDQSKLARAACYGYDALLLENLDAQVHTFDFIFNTIPAMVFDAPLAELIKPEAAVIDIASAPGGVDFNACRKHSVRAKLCPGLPGAYSPLSSGHILFEAVMDRL